MENFKRLSSGLSHIRCAMLLRTSLPLALSVTDGFAFDDKEACLATT